MTTGKTLGLVLGSLFPIPVEAQTPRVVRDDKGNTTPKLSRDGKSATYRTGLTAFRLDEHGNPVGEDRDVTLAVRKPVEIKAGVYYEPTGRTWVVHYANDRGRGGLHRSRDRRPCGQEAHGVTRCELVAAARPVAV